MRLILEKKMKEVTKKKVISSIYGYIRMKYGLMKKKT